MKNQKWSRFFFLDADLQFTPDHVAALWNMDADIAVGCYPMKKLAAPYAAWVKGKLIRLEDIEEKADPFEVDFAGTGFMMIRRRVFEALQKAHPEWEYVEGNMGRDNGEGECWGFFQSPIETLEEAGPARVMLPEDYFFCRRARELGFKIMMHPQARLKHWGMHCYDGT